MLRIACLVGILTVTLACGACSQDSRPMASNDAYNNRDGTRFDADGNKMYDPSVGDHSRTGYADGDRGEYRRQCRVACCDDPEDRGRNSCRAVCVDDHASDRIHRDVRRGGRVHL